MCLCGCVVWVCACVRVSSVCVRYVCVCVLCVVRVCWAWGVVPRAITSRRYEPVRVVLVSPCVCVCVCVCAHAQLCAALCRVLRPHFCRREIDVPRTAHTHAHAAQTHNTYTRPQQHTRSLKPHTLTHIHARSRTRIHARWARGRPGVDPNPTPTPNPGIRPPTCFGSD